MQSRFGRRFFCLVGLLGFLPGLAGAADVLLVTDIHFNPFAACYQGNTRYVGALVGNHKVSEWKFPPVAPATYKQETDSASLDEEMAEIHRVVVAQKIDQVFICGDMLEHRFDVDFTQYVHQPEQKAAFSSDVVLYVLSRIRAATGNAEIYFVLGNNDSDNGDYQWPSLAFRTRLAAGLFTPEESADRKAFIAMGYSSRRLNDAIQVIGLDANLLTQANSDAVLAKQQLAALQHDLEQCRTAHRRAIVLMHEPFGMDAYTSVKQRKIVPFLNQELQNEYLRVLSEDAPTIPAIYAGHCHMEYFVSVAGTIPLVGSLALNSLFGNNPGFKVVTIDDHTGDLKNYTTYFEDISQPVLRWQEMYQYAAAYPAARQSAVEMINRFPEALTDPKVRDYRSYYAGKSPRHQPISDDAAWPDYYETLTKLTPASFGAALKK